MADEYLEKEIAWIESPEAWDEEHLTDDNPKWISGPLQPNPLSQVLVEAFFGRRLRQSPLEMDD